MVEKVWFKAHKNIDNSNVIILKLDTQKVFKKNRSQDGVLKDAMKNYVFI